MRLERVATPSELQNEWRALAEASGNVFSTFEWADCWWRNLGGGRELALHVLRDDGGAAVAILPLYLWRGRPLRVLRFVGHGPADQLGPVCAPVDLPRAAAAVREVVAAVGASVLVAEQLPGDAGLAAALGGRVLARGPSPVLRFEGRTWDDLLKARSSNLREQVRRKERKLFREHEAAYRLADDPERLPRDLDTLFSLHRARWSAGGSAFAPVERFHREFAAVALERGWARLWLLEVDGVARAAWYGFRFGGAEGYYQAGRDPGWDGASVGFVLLAHSIRAAVEDGLDEYRFLRGGESFKYRFASDDPGLETVGASRGAAGAAALRAAELGRSGGRRLRALAGRLREARSRGRG